MPPQRRESASRPTRLSFTDREEIACRRAAGAGIRAIARAIGRSPSTVSRELIRGTRRPKTGYRATVAQALADNRARRPKMALLCRDTRLRAYVERQLVLKHSPEQISQRLLIDFSDDPEMRVTHETIYQSLYVQGRGALKRELAQCLRTGRALRKPHRKADERRSRHAGAVSISERPAEVEDRAVPGHWEGNLITGQPAPQTPRMAQPRRSTRSATLATRQQSTRCCADQLNPPCARHRGIREPRGTCGEPGAR